MRIVIEGPDGAGKSTLVQGLRKKLLGYHFTKEPSDYNEELRIIREVLKQEMLPLNAQVKLFNLSRRLMSWELDITNALYDRSVISSLIYQGVMNDKLAVVEEVNKEWLEKFNVDIIVILTRGKDNYDSARRDFIDVFDNADIEYHKRLNHAYKNFDYLKYFPSSKVILMDLEQTPMTEEETVEYIYKQIMNHKGDN